MRKEFDSRPNNFWGWLITLSIPALLVGYAYYFGDTWRPLPSPQVLWNYGETPTFEEPSSYTFMWDKYPTETDALRHCEAPILIVSPPSSEDGEQEEEWGCPNLPEKS